MNGRTINSVASAIGLAFLIGMVTLAAFLFSSGRHFWTIAIAGYLVTIPFAIAVWNDALWRHTTNGTQASASWRDWVGVFFAGLAVSMLFVALDMAVAHPGFSLMFTIAVVSLTFIALPSAIRAWLVQLLSNRYGNSDR